MFVHEVVTHEIEVGPRHRKLDKNKVKQIAESMKAIGLQHPIHVWDASDNKDHTLIRLVAGGHRLAAALDLGWRNIDCVIVRMDELDRELWQIDENLMRFELEPGELASHTSRRGKIIKARKKSSAKLANDSRRGPKDTGQVEFVAETAAMTRKSIRSVARDKRRGDLIAPDVMESIKDMPAYKSGVELDALASLWPKDQPLAVERVNSGASKNFREAKVFLVGEQEKQRTAQNRRMDAEQQASYTERDRKKFEDLKSAFTSASENTQEMFTEWFNERDGAGP